MLGDIGQHTETWHVPLGVVKSYHLLKQQSPMATIADKAAAAGDYG